MTMRQGETWQCPFCLHFQVLGSDNLRTTSGIVGGNRNKHGVNVGKITAVECMNESCKEICLWADFGRPLKSGGSTFPNQLGESKIRFTLRPTSRAKPQHSAVPAVLVRDYEEACAIADASPKASATLSRRCLQGMIRDFCKISKATLHAEIQELRRQVDDGTAPRQVSEESIEAIDSVRQVGNIGAHFEKDINLIIDVEPEEASALISLTELLFQEWYFARHERQSRLGNVKAIAGAKHDAKKGTKAAGLIKDGVDNPPTSE
jgi:hypothetical protein